LRLTGERLESRLALSNCNSAGFGTDRDDVVRIAQSFGSDVAGGRESGDFNFDGELSLADLVTVQTNLAEYRFGSAPDPPYPTSLARDGARHAITEYGPGFDEIRFLGPLVPGATSAVRVRINDCGDIAGWIDFDGDGDWDEDEKIGSEYTTDYEEIFVFDVPELAVPTAPGQPTYARFRVARSGELLPTGAARNGSVRDMTVEVHAVRGDEFDYGDGPLSYETTGYKKEPFIGPAAHLITAGMHLGISIDGEPIGTATDNADGDDLSGMDDEDGVRFMTPLVAGQPAQVEFTVSLPADPGEDTVSNSYAWLSLWIDSDANGRFESSERALDAVVNSGTQTISFEVPTNVRSDVPTFVRARLSRDLTLSPTGFAFDGEVEDYQVQLVRAPADFGDAPDVFRTLQSSQGAFHVLDSDYYLGGGVDAEPDGQPTAAGDGDDLTGTDDDDGVTFLTPLVAGLFFEFEATASASGYLSAFVGDQGNGLWTLVEAVQVAPGVNRFRVFVPEHFFSSPVESQAVVRVRYSSAPVFNPIGHAANGEVEDYVLPLAPRPDEAYDHGDAPIFTGLREAVHLVTSTAFLGEQIDGEPSKLESYTADGDDLGGIDDEDGVRFLTPLVAGQPATVEVTASVAGRLWACFNWTGGQCTPVLGNGLPVNAGINTLTIDVPSGARPSGPSAPTYGRFRFTTAGNFSADVVPDGEVEDYGVEVLPPAFDFGDVPFAGDTARHEIRPGVYLGSGVDAEAAGQSSVAADGDDQNGIDDEDGVRVMSAFALFHEASIEVSASGVGALTAWMRFSDTGPWEQISFVNRGTVAQLAAGLNPLNFQLPPSAQIGPAYLRIRFASSAVSSPTGLAASGEIEDYQVNIEEARYDFGDAPGRPEYHTLHGHSPARHVILDGLYLGNGVDQELNGNAAASADGDDLAGADDEDGITFATPLVRGTLATLEVVASQPGVLNAWIDFDGINTFDPVLFSNDFFHQPLSAGVNTVQIHIPPWATLTPDGQTTFARFRFTSSGIFIPWGDANSGEVEDYAVSIVSGAAPSAPHAAVARVSPNSRAVLTAARLSGPGVDRVLADSADDDKRGPAAPSRIVLRASRKAILSDVSYITSAFAW
jgi:hypothetical protein